MPKKNIKTYNIPLGTSSKLNRSHSGIPLVLPFAVSLLPPPPYLNPRSRVNDLYSRIDLRSMNSIGLPILRCNIACQAEARILSRTSSQMRTASLRREIAALAAEHAANTCLATLATRLSSTKAPDGLTMTFGR